MYLITGGAGFIGSNIAAALEDRGADIVIGDRLGSSDTKWRNIAKRRVHDIVPPSGDRRIPRALPRKGSRRRAYGRHFDHDRDRRQFGHPQQRAPFDRSVDPLRRGRHSADLRVVGFDLRRRPIGFRRPVRRRLPFAPQAPEPLRLEQARVRSLGRAGDRDGRFRPATLGGAQILQCLRAERVSQGKPALGRRSTARTNSRARPGPPVSLGQPRISRRRPIARLRLGRRLRQRGAVGARASVGDLRGSTMSAPESRARSSTWRRSCSGSSGSSPRSNTSICPTTCRTSTSIIHAPTWKSCAPPDSPSRRPRSRRASGGTCATFSRPTIRSVERALRSAGFMLPLRADPRFALERLSGGAQ